MSCAAGVTSCGAAECRGPRPGLPTQDLEIRLHGRTSCRWQRFSSKSLLCDADSDQTSRRRTLQICPTPPGQPILCCMTRLVAERPTKVCFPNAARDLFLHAVGIYLGRIWRDPRSLKLVRTILWQMSASEGDLGELGEPYLEFDRFDANVGPVFWQHPPIIGH